MWQISLLAIVLSIICAVQASQILSLRRQLTEHDEIMTFFCEKIQQCFEFCRANWFQDGGELQKSKPYIDTHNAVQDLHEKCSNLLTTKKQQRDESTNKTR